MGRGALAGEVCFDRIGVVHVALLLLGRSLLLVSVVSVDLVDLSVGDSIKLGRVYVEMSCGSAGCLSC